MNKPKLYQAYIYACDQHPVGEFIREIEEEEELALEIFGETVSHATNCWLKGCQHLATQVRIAQVQKGTRE